MIKNPVLKGFNPDPSSVRVGDTVYIAVSTFEWVPGVRIYQTKDLINYTYVTDILTNSDFRGNPKDCSIWAPQISYVDGEFYLIYTDVKSTMRPFKDTHNYLIKSKNIKGPWSDPIYINSSGFDPSLYHDGNRTYLLNCQWDYRFKEPNKSVGIIMQEFDRKTNMPIGEFKNIFAGTKAAKTEAPHIYKLNGYYYLFTAEGGTGSDHQVTVCRSKNIWGPYQIDPQAPLLTSKNHPELELQCAGHASLIVMPNHRMYIYHLATRPVEGKYAVLGRETAIQEVVIEDDWFRLVHGGNLPANEIDISGKQIPIKDEFYDDFKKMPLHHEWNMLRYYNSQAFKQHPRGLEMIAGESIQSFFDVNLIGKRLTSFNFICETEVVFDPIRFNQMAGLGLYTNVEALFFAYVTYDEKAGKVVRYFKKAQGQFYLYDLMTPVESDATNLKIVVEDFYIHVIVNGEEQSIKEHIGFLSGGFIGTYMTLSAHDLDFNGKTSAIFKYFKYQGQDK